MKRTLRDGLLEIVVSTGEEPLPGERLAPLDEEAALVYLRPFASDPANVGAMRALLSDDAGLGGLIGLRDGEVVLHLARRLARGRLHAVRRRVAVTPGYHPRDAAGPMAEPEPAQPMTKTETTARPAPAPPEPADEERIDAAAQAATLRQAARYGMPFCEACERARRGQEARAAAA